MLIDYFFFSMFVLNILLIVSDLFEEEVKVPPFTHYH